MRISVPVEVESPTINIIFPDDMPLMCDGAEVERRFGISAGTLAKLRKVHKDFPVKCIGRGVWYLVPDLYAWFRDYPEPIIPTD